jgi:hypothetical protein
MQMPWQPLFTTLIKANYSSLCPFRLFPEQATDSLSKIVEILAMLDIERIIS